MASIEAVLGKGYFPKELPKPFTTATYAGALLPTAPPAFVSGGGPRKSCLHNLARPGTLVRSAALPDPVHFYRLVSLIVTNWASIDAGIGKAGLSLTRPIDDPRGVRAWVPADSPDRTESRAYHASHARFRITADVSQWYPSTYTHTLDWAVRGKAVAKADTRRRTGLGPLLDIHTRAAQDGQSIGLPIGPDTSLVLGELLLAQVDAELTDILPKTTHGFRYYDDYELFATSRSNAEQAITALVTVLGEWQLVLNAYKVDIVELPVPIEDEWISVLKRIRVRRHSSQEHSDLSVLFDEAFRLRRTFSRDPVLSYAIGRFISRHNEERQQIGASNWTHFERLLLQASVAEPGVVQKAGHLIRWADDRGRTIDRVAIGSALNMLAADNARKGNSSEVAWCIWLATQLDVPIRAGVARAVAASTDDIVVVTALHAYEQGAIKRLDTKLWEPLMTRDALLGEHWLLAYEAYVHGWLPSADGSDFIATDPAFEFLRRRNVRFYDDAQMLPAAAIAALVIPEAPLPELVEPEEAEYDEYKGPTSLYEG